MDKLKVSQYQRIEATDLNSVGQYAQDGINELVSHLLGGVGTVVWGGSVAPGAAGLTVDVAALTAIAPAGTTDEGALIVMPNAQTLVLPGNSTGADVTYIVQIGYREIDGTTEQRSFVDPVTDVEYAANTDTETVPDPEIKAALSLDAGFVALASVVVEAGNTGNLITTSNIVDLRTLRTDGLRDVYRERTSSTNQADTPAPVATGGGTVWLEVRRASHVGFPYVEVDNSIDWRDRFIQWKAWFYRGVELLLPGETDDAYLWGARHTNISVSPHAMVDDNNVESGIQLASGMFYSGIGGSATGRARLYSGAGWVDQFRLYVDVNTGKLKFDEETGVSDISVVVCIQYSPKQNHYQVLP